MLWILFCLSFISEVHGYGDGYFPESCQSMSVEHPAPGRSYAAPQTSDPPFEVVFPYGTEGDPVTVSVRSTSSALFRGFMLEARKTNDMTGPPVGKFIQLVPRTTRLLACHGAEASAVSKLGNRQRSEMNVNWTAQGEERDITFRATFVQEYQKFWERVDFELSPPASPPASNNY